MFSAGVQGHENLSCLSFSFEQGFVLHGRGIDILLRGIRDFSARDAFLGVMGLFSGVAFLAFDKAFLPGDYFGHREHRLLGEELIEVSFLESVIAFPHEHLLVWRDFLDRGFVKSG